MEEKTNSKEMSEFLISKVEARKEKQEKKKDKFFLDTEVHKLWQEKLNKFDEFKKNMQQNDDWGSMVENYAIQHALRKHQDGYIWNEIKEAKTDQEKIDKSLKKIYFLEEKVRYIMLDQSIRTGVKAVETDHIRELKIKYDIVSSDESHKNLSNKKMVRLSGDVDESKLGQKIEYDQHNEEYIPDDHHLQQSQSSNIDYDFEKIKIDNQLQKLGEINAEIS